MKTWQITVLVQDDSGIFGKDSIENLVKASLAFPPPLSVSDVEAVEVSK